MIAQNRAVPVLAVVTMAFILFTAGCFDTEGTTSETRAEEEAAPTPAPPPPPPPVVVQEATTGAIDGSVPPPQPLRVPIEPGDTLNAIATRYCTTVPAIRRANPDLDPDLLIAGDELIIPNVTTECANASNPDAADREPGEVASYIVEQGDTLGAIADEYQVSLDALLEENAGLNPSNLQVGQELIIPPVGTGLSADELEQLGDPCDVPDRQPGEPPLVYSVRPGDSLTSIATCFNVSVDAIVVANNLADENEPLAVGQNLTIPPPNS